MDLAHAWWWLLAKSETCRTIYIKTLKRCSCDWPPFFPLFNLQITALTLINILTPRCNSPQCAKGSLLSRLHDHTRTQHNRQLSSRRVIGQTHRDLYLTTHKMHKRPTSVPSGGIRTSNSSKRAAADPRLRPRGHWDRQLIDYYEFS
jgi:hypothetical protein